MLYLKILTEHGIETRVEGNKLLALELSTFDGHSHTEWLDVTGWTMDRLLLWLGY